MHQTGRRDETLEGKGRLLSNARAVIEMRVLTGGADAGDVEMVDDVGVDTGALLGRLCATSSEGD